jgi:hypothetical protein
MASAHRLLHDARASDGALKPGGLRPAADLAPSACGVYGAQGRNRTSDTAIFSRMLYQLSYLGTG